MDAVNPYQSPSGIGRQEEPLRPVREKASVWLYVAWAGVLALNLLVPLSFAALVVAGPAVVGMLLAVVVLLALGWGMCWRSQAMVLPLIIGGVAVALSQVLPLLQIIAGSIGLGIVEELGWGGEPPNPRDFDPDIPEMIYTTLGGFTATLVTGGVLVFCAGVLGLGLWVITPGHWWRARPPVDSSSPVRFPISSGKPPHG